MRASPRRIEAVEVIGNPLNHPVSLLPEEIGVPLTVIAHGNLIKKIVGLSIFQTSVFIFYISTAKVDGGTAPILAEGIEQYSNPLPHVLILTAIVVGIATTALGLALAVRIKEAYGSIEEESIQNKDNQEC